MRWPSEMDFSGAHPMGRRHSASLLTELCHALVVREKDVDARSFNHKEATILGFLGWIFLFGKLRVLLDLSDTPFNLRRRGTTQLNVFTAIIPLGLSGSNFTLSVLAVVGHRAHPHALQDDKADMLGRSLRAGPSAQRVQPDPELRRVCAFHLLLSFLPRSRRCDEDS